jgi:hypothetical protein
MQCILILEDDLNRTNRFRETLRRIAPELTLICWQSARKMIREMAPHLSNPQLISLDHDLYPPVGESEDPGDGLEVAKALAASNLQCPVIIHSSNADRTRMMQGEFELARIPCNVVLPLGKDWIERYWSAAVRELLDRS